MAKLTNDNDNETIEIATDENVYIPIASTQTVGVAKFNPNDFVVSQDGQVTSLQKVGGVQYMGTIVSQGDDSTLEWKLSDVSDDNTNYPRVNDKIMLLENFEGTDRIHTAGEVYVITSVDNYDVTKLTPVYTGSDYLVSYKGTSSTVEVNSTTTLAAGSKATVENVGTEESVLLNFGIPGSSTIEVSDTVVPLAPATTPIVKNVGTKYAAKLQFSIPTTQKLKAANFNMLNSWEDGSIEVDEENSTENELVLTFNVPRGYPGQSFHIDDQVYTIGDLPAATEANIGRVYVVGESVPYDMYVCIYDEDTSTYQWLNLGHIMGVKDVDKATKGLVDTYTVTMDDGYTFQFTITNGAQGDTGVGLKSVTEYYLAISESVDVTIDTDGWQTTIPTISGTNRYLWNYEHVEYTDGTTSDTDPALIGTWGVGISSITNYYGLSTSNSSQPTTWYTSPQTITSTWKYLWNYEVVMYEDDTKVTTEPAIIGVYGDTGSNGTDGNDGEDGVGISTITKYYLVSTSNTGVTTSTSGWSTSIPTMTSTYKYLWNYDVIVYTDGSEQTTTPGIIGVYGDTGETGEKGDTGETGEKGDTGDTVSIVRLYHLATSSTAYADQLYDYDTAVNSAGFTTEFQSVTADYMYEFVLEYTKTVTYSSSSIYVYAETVTFTADAFIWAAISNIAGSTFPISDLIGTDDVTPVAGDTIISPQGMVYTITVVEDTYVYAQLINRMSGASGANIWATSSDIADSAFLISDLTGIDDVTPATGDIIISNGASVYIITNVKTVSYEPSYATPQLCAKYGADGADGAVTAETIYNALTENDVDYGCFYSTDGKLYIKAEYIRSGEISTDITYTGSLIATNANISGTLTSTSGTIGGFTIGSSSLYTNSKTSYSSSTSGVYIGTSGIGLGAGTFYVTSAGYLYSTSGSIGGFIISNTSLIYSGSISLNGSTRTLYIFSSTTGTSGTHISMNYNGLTSTYRISGGSTTYPYEELQVTASNGFVQTYYSSSSNETVNSISLYLDPNNDYLPTLRGVSAVTSSSTTVTNNLYVASNLVPTTSYSIGTSSIPWPNIYLNTLNFINTYSDVNIDANNTNTIGTPTNGGHNVYIGTFLQDVSPDCNVLIGYYNNAYAKYSIVMGYENSLMYDSSTDLSIRHTVLIGGNNTCYDRYSVAIGYNNSCMNASTPNASQGYNTAMGYQNTIYGTHNTAIGMGNTIGTTGTTFTACTCVGRGNTCTSNYEVRLGYSSGGGTLYVGGTQFTSDERDKIDIQDYDDNKSLEFILSLRTVSYVDNARIYYEYMDTNDDGEEVFSESHCKYGLGYYDTEAHAAGTKKGSRRRSGVLAQDVTEQMENVFGDSDYVNIVNDSLNNKIANGETIPEGIESNKTVSYTSFIPFLISAMRAQQKQIEALQEVINNL